MCKSTRKIQYVNKEPQSAKSVRQQILKEGAQRLLQEKVLHEVQEYIRMHSDKKDCDGKRLVVKNGYMPEREIVTGMGPIAIR